MRQKEGGRQGLEQGGLCSGFGLCHGMWEEYSSNAHMLFSMCLASVHTTMQACPYLCSIQVRCCTPGCLASIMNAECTISSSNVLCLHHSSCQDLSVSVTMAPWGQELGPRTHLQPETCMFFLPHLLPSYTQKDRKSF